jgi:DNA helicase II / ATP-dependent DNA helicase PcrA
MSAAYLEKLNDEQRRAVEHGVLRDARDVPVAPLLVIAGAGDPARPTHSRIGLRI